MVFAFMSYDPKRFYELWGEVFDLLTTEEMLRWDQETMMPRRGTTVAGRCSRPSPACATAC